MNIKHQKYIEYIVRDIELPYIKYLNMYGLNKEDMELVLSKVFNQPVVYIKQTCGVYNKKKNNIYHEYISGTWIKYEYDNNGNVIYREDSNGSWEKREYDSLGYLIYSETTNGVIRDNRYERQV